ncbi:hypothetical protein WME88_27645 [Sorangium sp. So ce216]
MSRRKPAGRAARRAQDAALDLRHEDARTRAMLNGLQPEIHRLAPEAVAHAASHVLFAGDPRAEFMISDLDAARVERIHATLGTEPFVGMLPRDAAESLIVRFAEIEPAAHDLLRRFHEPIGPRSFRLMTVCGRALGLQTLTVGVCAPELVNGLPIVMTPADAQPEPGGDSYLLSPMGIVKWLLMIDVAEVKKEHRRKQIERMQERARAVWAADAIRVQPRSFDDVIAEEFKVARLRAALREAIVSQDGSLIDRALDALFGSCEAVS